MAAVFKDSGRSGPHVKNRCEFEAVCLNSETYWILRLKSAVHFGPNPLSSPIARPAAKRNTKLAAITAEHARLEEPAETESLLPLNHTEES